MTLPNIRDEKKLKGRRVIVRASLNAPVEGGRVVNDFRIRKALATLAFLKEKGARTVVVAHIGRDKTASLEPVYRTLRDRIACSFSPALFGDDVRTAVENLKDGNILLLENLRSHDGEVNNADAFAAELATYGDIYINDAFAASHREHASIVGVPALLPHYAGLQLQEEVSEVSKARTPQSPSLCILGGAKFATKAPLIEQLLSLYDHVMVAGALSNDIFKARGYAVGRSSVSDITPSDTLLSHPRLSVPTDVTVLTSEGNSVIKKPEDVDDGDMIVDAGPDTLNELGERIEAARFILWNGPLGAYEKGFRDYTEILARQISSSQAYSIVGGGDTIAAIAALNLEEKINFMSTGGGAMLAFLENGTLPGVDALLK